jgi:PAS domain S-box-containing protein
LANAGLQRLQAVEAAADALRERDALYKGASRKANWYNRSKMEAALDPQVTIGSDGKIADVNRATETITGRTRFELIGSDFSDCFTQPELARAGYHQVFREGAVQDYPLEMKHSDGRTTPVLYNASVYRDEAGEVQGVFAAAHDITERKEAQDRLHESEVSFRSIVEQAPDGIVLTDEQGIVIEWNRAQETLTGLPRQAAVGKAIWDLQYLSSPDEKKADRAHAGRLQDTMQAFLTSGEADWVGQAHEREITRPDGSSLVLEMVAFPVRTGAGFMACSHSRDVSRRSAAEKEQRRSFQLLEERVKELRALHDVAHVLSEEKGPDADLLKELCAVLPRGWQYPENTACRISYGDLETETLDFERTPWSQRAEFRTEDGTPGAVEVVYRESRPLADEGPFLSEERKLIDSVAGMISSSFNRRQAEAAVCQSEGQYAALFAGSAIGTALTDTRGRVLKTNPALEHFLGYPPRN